MVMKKNEEILGRIYIIRNNVNSKVYVGQTIRALGERWAGHKCDAINGRKSTAICNAIRKYGADSFYIELLEDNIPYSLLDEKEIEYIREYNSVSPNGYNISFGGQTYKTEEERLFMRERVLGEKNPMYGACGEKNPFYGKQHSKEARKILSEKSKQYYMSLSPEEKRKNMKRLDEARVKMIKMYGGGFKGRNHTEDAKRRISEKLKGKKFSEEHNRKISENSTRKRQIVMLDKEGNYLREFDSMTNACRYIKESNIHEKPMPGVISTVCYSSDRSTAYGYMWLYKEEYDENKTYNSRAKGKEVICLNNLKAFKSMTLAGEEYGVKRGIDSCCRGEQKTSGKDKDGDALFWMYYDDYLKLDELEIKRIRDEITEYNKKNNKDRRVICLTTNSIFENPPKACKEYGIKSTSDIYKCLKGERKSAGKLQDGTKLTWAWYEEYINNKEELETA